MSPTNPVKTLCTALSSFAALVALANGCATGAKHPPAVIERSEARGGEDDSSAHTADERSAAMNALDWMSALRQRDSAKLAAQTAYPFRLHDTRTEGECTDSLAGVTSELDAALACLLTDELLQEDLMANPEPLAETVAMPQLPEWSKPWRSELALGDVAVSVVVPGNGSAFYFVVIVAANGVRGLWKHTTFESN